MSTGQARGEIRRSVRPTDLAAMLLASLEGAVALARLAPHSATREAVARPLIQWIESMRR